MAERSVNKVILIGRLGKDAEQKFTQSGTAVSTFSIATSRRWKDQASGEWKDATDWTNIVFWRSENVIQYLVKGTKLYIEGRLQTRHYENKEGRKVYVTEVVAEELILLGGKEDRGAPSGGEQYDRPRNGAASKPGPAASPDPPFDSGAGGLGITDEDVPF